MCSSNHSDIRQWSVASDCSGSILKKTIQWRGRYQWVKTPALDSFAQCQWKINRRHGAWINNHHSKVKRIAVNTTSHNSIGYIIVMFSLLICTLRFNSFTPGPNGRHFTDDIFGRTFMNKKFRILIKISLKVVPEGPIDNKPALVWIMALRRLSDKPLSESMLTRYIWRMYAH